MKSLKSKIVILIAVLLVIVCAGFGVISYLISAYSVEKEVENYLTEIAKESAKVVSSCNNEQLNALEAIAAMNEISGPNISIEEKLQILSKEVKRSGHIRMGIADLNGDMKSTDGSSTNIKDRVHFKKPIEGVNTVSDPIISKINGSVIMSFGVPIKYNDQIIGVLVAVRDGNNLSNTISDITFGKSGKAFLINKSGVTIAHENNELVLNMYNAIEEAKNDSKLLSFANLLNQMIEGNAGSGQYTYEGVSKKVGFAPVEGADWYIAVEAPEKEILSRLESLKANAYTMSGIFIIVGIIIAYLIAAGVANPIKRLSKVLSVIATGDFRQVVPEKYQKRKNEMGLLARSIDTMQSSIRNIVNGVLTEAFNVEDSVKATSARMEELNAQIHEVSATTEELSAGMEETAASSEEINATSLEIESAIESIAVKAQEGAVVANEINTRANELKSNIAKSQQSANAIYAAAQEKLKNAIQQSKAVEQINVLSEAILQITSQTNLLALNAAIEAARAGESGKGFAVVADEIRQLAEDSKRAVTEIQRVTKEVVSSVENLSESSQEMLNFMDKTVFDDYKAMAGAGDQYNKDAQTVNEIIIELSATTEQLSASVENMIKAIGQITSATNEGAAGTQNIAEKATIIVEKAADVMRQKDIAEASSNKLVELVSAFKV